MVRGPLPKAMESVIEDLRSQRGDEVFHTQVSQATAVAESVEEHLPVFRHKPDSMASRQAQDLTDEFYERTSGE